MTVQYNNHNLLTVSEASERMAAKTLSSQQLVRSCLTQISHREPSVKAWEFINRDPAIEQAEKSDASPGVGPIRGVPIGIKDIVDTADMPTTYGSPLYHGHQPARDAVCVDILRRRGAVILGKTVSTEFAYLQPSRTTNPHNSAYSPGGSSSGSAAAVAACMVPAALATQTAGSCIRPASYCGVVGYKPTFDLFDISGIMPLAQSLDTLSIIARSVRDVSIVGSQLNDRLQAIPSAPTVRSIKIGFAKLPAEWSEVHPDAFSVYKPLKRKLSDAGIPFGDVDLSSSVEGLHELHGDILSFEAAGNFAEIVDLNGDRISAPIRGLVERGRAIPRHDFEKKQIIAARRRAEIDDALSNWDVVLTPSAPNAAPPLAAGTGLPIFNSFWTLLHVPCLTIPVLRTTAGLPVGVQLTTRRGGDNSLLRSSAFLASILCEHQNG